MAQKLVTVTIAENGELEVETSGFQGKGCKAVTEAFASMGKVKSENTKPEFYSGGGATGTVSTGS